MSIKGIPEEEITRYIVLETAKDLAELSNVDVVVVGAGPSGMVAGYYLVKEGLKTVILERRLSFGGGIGGGGMLFHKILVEYPANEILDEMNIRYKRLNDKLFILDSAELMAGLAYAALKEGAKIIHGVTVEDVIYRLNPLRITGVVIQWSAVILSGLHVDPLFIKAKAIIDATGHEAEVLSIVAKKIPESNLKVHGHKPAYSEEAERLVVEKTGKVLPGLYVTGMAVASLYGLPRMGPIFGGMLLSGRKVANEVIKDIKGE